MRLLDAILSWLRLWRRARGGHWERWYIESPVYATIWLRLEECSHASLHRPYGGRGTPTCETW